MISARGISAKRHSSGPKIQHVRAWLSYRRSEKEQTDISRCGDETAAAGTRSPGRFALSLLAGTLVIPYALCKIVFGIPTVNIRLVL